MSETDCEHTEESYFAQRARLREHAQTIRDRVSQLHAHGVEIEDDTVPAFHRELADREQAD